MKFDKIILTGSESITLFDHRNPLSSPYVTQAIDGLAPTEVEVSLAQTIQGAGLYIGRRPQLREITCNIHLNPNYTLGETPESLRERIYRLRPVSDDGSLALRLLYQDEEVARTLVYIKRVELAPFAKETIMQLVLASPSEYLFREQPIVLTSPEFDKTYPVLPNVGSARTGFYIRLMFTGTASVFGFGRRENAQELRITHAFALNDILEINTQIGSRGIWLTRAGVKTSIIGSLSANSTWLDLHPGETALHVITTNQQAFNWVEFSYQPKYLGV